MLRKFILVAFMALVAPGSTVQLMSAQLVCFAFVVLLVLYKPYKKDEADFTNQARSVWLGLAAARGAAGSLLHWHTRQSLSAPCMVHAWQLLL